MKSRQGRAALLLAVLALGALFTLARYRAPLSRVWGDEGTFLAMMASLTADGDLRFDDRDLARTLSAEGGRTHLILQRTERGVTYSKPVLFALASAPFYAVLGERGPVLLNVLALGFALALGHAYLRRLGDGGAAALVLVTYAGAAAVVPYVAWRMTDGFQGALALVALVLCLGRDRGRPPDAPRALDRLLEWRGAPILGAVLLAMLVTMRMSNAVLAAVPVLAALLARRFRSAGLLASTVAGAYLLLAGLTLQLAGAPNPYRAARTTFTPATGYPAGDGAVAAEPRFDEMRASDRTGLATHAGPRRVAHSAFYFFAGRHTGLLAYFPAAVVFLAFAARRPDRIGRAALAAFAAAFAFFVVWRADNYFGGDTFIGNRYFLSLYPLLLVALPRLPPWRWLAAAWGLAGLSYVSALLSVTRYHELDAGSQSHAHAGIFRLLPYESTARDIVGRRDRYWAGHFVRFVDPFPGVGRWHAELFAGRPPAELLMAHWRPLGNIRLFVDTAAPQAILEVRDYGRRREIPVGTAQAVASRGPLGVPVDLRTSRPWRRHRYWWDAETLYSTRSLRLALRVPGGGEARAKVRYFGDPHLLEQTFSYERLGEEAPERAAAGGSSRVSFRVRNTGPLIWEPEDVVPVRAGYRIYGGDGTLLAGSGRLALPHRVEPYEPVEVSFDVDWPGLPGRCRLEADLVLEHVAWFGERLGSPVLRREVDVTVEE